MTEGFSKTSRFFVCYLGDLFVEATLGEVVNEAGFYASLRDIF